MFLIEIEDKGCSIYSEFISDTLIHMVQNSGNMMVTVSKHLYKNSPSSCLFPLTVEKEMLV